MNNTGSNNFYSANYVISPLVDIFFFLRISLQRLTTALIADNKLLVKLVIESIPAAVVF